jgi:hypothetical protein
MHTRVLPLIALLCTVPSQAAEAAGADMATAITREIQQKEDAARAGMERYWEAQPDAPAVIPGQFLTSLKKLPWPDMRPEPKAKYYDRPEVKARELSDEEADPLLAGLAKKEKSIKNEREAAQRENDEERYALWKRNYDFFLQGMASCKAGTTSGADRVALLEAAQAFIKEGMPRFYLMDTKSDSADLERMSGQVQTLIASLYQQGQYVPDYRSLLWAERIGGHLAGGVTPVSEKEKRSYYKIIARLHAFDPRAPEAEANSGGALSAAPAGATTNPGMEPFLQGLVEQCNKAIAGLNVSAATPAQYPAIGNKAEQAIRKMLASFPRGWQDDPRARWAHGWFAEALEKSGKAGTPLERGMTLFKALDQYEAGLKAGL